MPEPTEGRWALAPTEEPARSGTGGFALVKSAIVMTRRRAWRVHVVLGQDRKPRATAVAAIQLNAPIGTRSLAARSLTIVQCPCFETACRCLRFEPLRKLVWWRADVRRPGAGGCNTPSRSSPSVGLPRRPIASRKPVRVNRVAWMPMKIDARERAVRSPISHIVRGLPAFPQPRPDCGGQPAAPSSPITSQLATIFGAPLSGTSALRDCPEHLDLPAATRRSTSAVWLRRSRAVS